MSLLELALKQEAQNDEAFIGVVPEGMGREEITANDIQISRLAIAQDLSPQLKPMRAEYIEGAAVGDILDIGMGLVREAVLFCPVKYMKRWVEWAPRKTQEGVVAIHKSDPFQNPSFNPGVNSVEETAYFFGWIMEDDGTRRPTYIAMKGSHLANARQLTTLSDEMVSDGEGNQVVPPLCYRTYVLSTRHTSNAEGDWFLWHINRGPTLAQCCSVTGRSLESAYDQAKELFEAASGHFVINASEDQARLGPGSDVAEEEDPF